MISHAPSEYQCPFCALVNGVALAGLISRPADIVWRDDKVVAFIASHWWRRNPGHVLIIPVHHFENLYDLPDEIGASVFTASRRIAVAMRATYRCSGISTRQHNEPAGYQEVWHYHLHVFPRYPDDQLYAVADAEKYLSSPAERLPFALKLRDTLRMSGCGSSIA